MKYELRNFKLKFFSEHIVVHSIKGTLVDLGQVSDFFFYFIFGLLSSRGTKKIASFFDIVQNGSKRILIRENRKTDIVFFGSFSKVS